MSADSCSIVWLKISARTSRGSDAGLPLTGLLKLPDESIKKKMFTSVVDSDRAHAASSANAPSPRSSAWATEGAKIPAESINANTAEIEKNFFIEFPTVAQFRLQI